MSSPDLPPAPTRRRGTVAVLAVLAAVGVLAAIAVLLTTGDDADAPRRASTAAPATATGAAAPRAPARKDASYLDADSPGVLSFENGDCFHDVAVNEAMGEPQLNTVECVGAENEVYAFTRLSGERFEHATLARQATRGCRSLADRVWTPEQRDALRFYPVLPSARSWRENDDRDAMCVVYSPDGPFRADPVTTGAAS